MDIPNLIALVLLAVGLPWLVYLGFKRGGVIWGLLVLFFSLIAGLAFCLKKKTGWLPWLLVLAGSAIAFAHKSRLI